jgi:hypothetical protein
MSDNNSPFLESYRGYLRNLLEWDDLDHLWQRLKAHTDKRWYIYAVGEAPPTRQSSANELERFIQEVDTLLRAEHHERYCGIVYVDRPEDPGFIKIYDPNNLGSVCGSSHGPATLPGWILSLSSPEDLEHALPQPGNRRRWWQQLFG